MSDAGVKLNMPPMSQTFQSAARIDWRAATTDNLATVNVAGSVPADMMLALLPSNGARAVTMKYGTGNLLLHGSADFTRDPIADRQLLAAIVNGSSRRAQAPSANNS